jgi:hypothetical protein
MNALPLFHNEDIRAAAREAVLLGARWHAHNQVRHQWPRWTADAGRFNSVLELREPAAPPVKSICWNTARGAQAVLSAYTLSGDPEMLQTAQLAMEYVKTCQLFAPEHPAYEGAFLEESPLCDHVAARDSLEAIQGLVDLHRVSGDAACLQRATAGADWWVDRYYLKGKFPYAYLWHREGDRADVHNDFSRLMLAAAPLPFAQLDALSGRRRYVPAVLGVLDWVLEHAMEPDGAIKLRDGTPVGHHAVRSGPLADCFTNDDGVGVALIAAHRATGAEKYAEAARRNGGWWLAMDGFPDTFASVPAGLLFLIEMARFTGEEAYVRKAIPYIERVLSMQHRDPERPELHGGFKGHDVVGDRERALLGSEPADCISHRTTMYAMMALAKVAASSDAEWNIAYSAFGY